MINTRKRSEDVEAKKSMGNAKQTTSGRTGINLRREPYLLESTFLSKRSRTSRNSKRKLAKNVGLLVAFENVIWVSAEGKRPRNRENHMGHCSERRGKEGLFCN